MWVIDMLEVKKSARSALVGAKAMIAGGALLLAACAAAPTVTTEDIELAERAGQLEVLFDQLQAQLDKARVGSSKALQLTQVRDDVGTRLAQPSLQRIDALLAAAGDSPLSLAELDELDGEILALRRFRPFERPELNQQASALRRQTDAEIARLTQRLSGLDGAAAGSRYSVLKQLAELDTSAPTQALYEQASQELSKLYAAGVSAVERKQLSVARDLFDQVAAADPAYRELVFYRELVEAGLFEQRFWQALVEGAPEDAYRIFHEFAQTAAYVTHGNRVAQDAMELAAYYDALGDKLRRQRNWLESFRAFEKSGFIRGKVDDSAQPSKAQQAFIDEMVRRYQASERARRQSEALAYLSIIENLDPGNAVLANNMGAAFGQVLEQARVRYDIPGFAGEHGEQLAQSVRQRLGNAGAAIVEGPSATAMMQFQVAGEVLNAAVDSTSAPRVEQREVLIGTVAGPNPAHEQWLQLPDEHRAQVPEPPPTVDVPRYAVADVPVSDVVVEAAMAVRVQVQTVEGAEVTLQDQFNERQVAEGLAVGAFNVGDHYYEAVAAPLPARGEMLQQLIDVIAQRIADRLIEQSAGAQAQYAAEAERLAADNRRAAVSRWSYAYVVSDPRSSDRAKLRRSMQEAVLRGGA